jgi:4-carboxymuconolactone decarboxylase
MTAQTPGPTEHTGLSGDSEDSEAQPRIEPLPGEVEGYPPLNLFKTLARHPKLLDRFGRFGGYLLYRGTLPPRERELVILRTGWRSGSVYEFGQHTTIGRDAGLTVEEVGRLAADGAAGWSETDADLVAFVDELCATNTVSDATWGRLAARWTEAELLELLVVAGFYRLVSGLLNATGVQREPGTPGWPDGTAPAAGSRP